MAEVLVIGIGSTGLSVMEETQKFYFEFTKKNSPGQNTAFIFLETAQAQPAKNANGQTEIQSCLISTKNANASLTNWHQNNNPEWNWLPNSAEMLNAGGGAGGRPVYGRVALWDNHTNVDSMIDNAYKSIGGNPKTCIYIVGSLTGGTGTGVFLDVAYMVQQITGNHNIYGMFLLPGNQTVKNPSKSGICENAYVSLKTIDHYMKSGNYKCTLPGGGSLTSPYLPFCNVQYYTPDFSNGNAGLSIPQLVQTVGFNLALRILNVDFQSAPFQNVVNARVQADYMSKVANGFFTTVGLNVFQYPEGLMEELFASQLIQDKMLARWNDSQNYFDKNDVSKTITSVEPILKIESNKFLEETLEKLIASNQGSPVLGSQSFAEEVEKDVELIVSKQTQSPSDGNFIFGLFNPNSPSANLYSAISGQTTNIRNAMIAAISEKVNQIANTYQNAHVVKQFLLVLCKSISDEKSGLLKLWERKYHLTGSTDNFTVACKKYLDDNVNSVRHIYSLMNCKREWWGQVIMGLSEMCYMDTLIPHLKKISDTITCMPGTTEMKDPNSGRVLPTTNKVDEQIEKLSSLLDGMNAQSVTSRISQIQSRLSNASHPQFHYLFNGANYNDDMNQALGKYNNLNKHLKLEDITPMLWDFWMSQESTHSMRDEMIQKSLVQVQSYQLFANADVATIMSKLNNTHPQFNSVNNLLKGTSTMISEDAPAMARLIPTEQFQPHSCLLTLIISDQPINSGIVPLMKGYQPSAVANAQTYVALSDMKNTVVVYQEYGYLGEDANNNSKVFNPLVHLDYQVQVKQGIVKKGNQFNESRLNLAYLDMETLFNDNVNIK